MSVFFVENTFDNDFVNFSLNVTTCGMFIDIVEIDKKKSHVILVAMETILDRNYEFLSYQNVCILKMAWRSINSIARVLNHITLESVGHQHFEKVCRFV